MLFQAPGGPPPPPPPSPDIGQSAALILTATGAAAGSSLLITGKGDFVGLVEIDLLVSSAVNFAVDSARLLIISVGGGWIGRTAALAI